MDNIVLTEEIEKLQECLNSMVVSEEAASEDILKISQELDCLILQYMKATLHI